MPGFELIGKEEKKAVNDVFEKSNGVLFAHGFNERRNNIFRVRKLEKLFAKKLGEGFSAACSSGTAAQYVAMKAMGIKPGDEVITQSFTFIATIEAILACGARPVVAPSAVVFVTFTTLNRQLGSSTTIASISEATMLPG